jgi:hypothetical protein
VGFVFWIFWGWKLQGNFIFVQQELGRVEHISAVRVVLSKLAKI